MASDRALWQDATLWAARIRECQYGLARMAEIDPAGYAADIDRVRRAMAEAERSLARYEEVMADRLVRETEAALGGAQLTGRPLVHDVDCDPRAAMQADLFDGAWAVIGLTSVNPDPETLDGICHDVAYHPTAQGVPYGDLLQVVLQYRLFLKYRDRSRRRRLSDAMRRRMTVDQVFVVAQPEWEESTRPTFGLTVTPRPAANSKRWEVQGVRKGRPRHNPDGEEAIAVNVETGERSYVIDRQRYPLTDAQMAQAEAVGLPEYHVTPGWFR